MFLSFCIKIMILAEKYLTKFIDNNKVNSPLNIFIKKIQSNYSADYRHSHPMTIQWNITPKCNLRCRHCYYAETPEIYLGSKSISFERNMSIIDEINNLNVFYLILSGGEALLTEGIFDILKKIKSKNIAIYMHSNGKIIDKSIAKNLAQIFVPKLDAIQISLDGLEEQHDKIRGKGSFKNAINAIKLLKDAGVTVCVNFTATKENMYDAIPVYNLATELGCYKFSIQKIVPSSKEQVSQLPDFEKLLEISCNLINLENESTFLELATYKLEEFITRKLALKFLINRSKEINNYIKDSTVSCHRHAQLFITFDGEVFACRDAYICPELSLGNLKKKSLINIWENRFNNDLFKERDIKELGSEKCPLLGICNCGCPLKSYAKNKNINLTCKNCAIQGA